MPPALLVSTGSWGGEPAIVRGVVLTFFRLKIPALRRLWRWGGGCLSSGRIVAGLAGLAALRRRGLSVVALRRRAGPALGPSSATGGWQRDKPARRHVLRTSPHGEASCLHGLNDGR